MEALIKKRSSRKATITRCEKWLIANKESVPSVQQFESRKKVLINAFREYNQIQEEIEELDDAQAIDRELVENLYCTLEGEFQEHIDKLNRTLNGASSISQQLNTQTYSDSFIKLPDLKIPEFTGEITQWENFIQLFNRTVTFNTRLNGAEKLTYLKSFLKGEPLQLIDTLTIDESNFQIAIDTLKDRYDNSLAVIYTHIKSLLDTAPLSKSMSLRTFITHVNQNIESLKNLKAYELDLFMVYILAQKLDSGTKRSFDFDCDTKVRPTLDKFIKFLENRCKVMERKIPESTSGPKQQNSKISHQVNVTNVKGPSFPNYKKFCIYCRTTNHSISKCARYNNLTHDEKREFIKRNSLCYNCLKDNHKTLDCQSRGCFRCNRKHHSSLHLSNGNSTQFLASQPKGYPTLSSSSKPFHNQDDIPATSSRAYSSSIQPSKGHSQQIPYKQFNQGCSQSSTSKQTNSSLTNSSSHDQSNSRRINSSQNTTSSQPPDPPILEQQESHQVLSTLVDSGNSLLATAQIILYSSDRKQIKVKAVLDPCSTTSLITRGLVQKLHLKTSPANIHIGGVGGIFSKSNRIVKNVNINSWCQGHQFTVDCVVVNEITQNLPQFPLARKQIPIPKDINLADPEFHVPSQIDVLLGADVYYSLITGGIIQIQQNFLTLLDTRLGYILGGKIPTQALSFISRTSDNKVWSMDHVCHISLNFDDHFLQRFWAIEEVAGETPTLSLNAEIAENIFCETTKILSNGSFQVNLPLLSSKEHMKLGNSFFQAKRRLLNLEKRFLNNPGLFLEYKNFIDEYVNLNHGRYVPLRLRTDDGNNKYFLPHHCVIKESSSTTKLRVVFDASMSSSSGVSLNDIMFKGYTVQPDLFDILCRFRMFKFVLIADIEKMYRQIRVNPEQAFLQNILWRNHPDEEIKCIELSTVTYGTKSAPFLATRAIKELALRSKDSFPGASWAILNQCYVDDILCGGDSLYDLKILYDELNCVFNRANFQLHKWSSNSTEFLNSIKGEQFQNHYDIKINNESSKVLGLAWNPVTDFLSISVPVVSDNNPNTKREVLSKIAQMFDPLGLVAPVIVTAKLIMQQIWTAKINWDDKLTGDLLSEWTRYLEDIPKLTTLQLPRYVFSNSRRLFVELHGFCDSSMKAYGACVYFRTFYSDNSISCQLITAKSRIAPLKTVTLPRLELCAGVLLSKLVSKVKSIFENQLQFKDVYMWTDSQIVLSWLKSHPSRWTTFVSNRVSEIQSLSGCTWRHVKSSDNPADCLTRGFSPDQLCKSSLWWHGPQALSSFDPHLVDSATILSLQDLPEQRQSKTVLLTKTDEFWLQVMSRFSSFTRLQRALSYCLRFIHNARHTLKKRSGPLSLMELQTSECTIILNLQMSCFQKELNDLKGGKPVSNKAILRLTPFLDSSGLIRVGGRLANSSISYDQKHPILLPSKSHVVSLMLKREHLRLGHAGAQTLLSNFRLKYWPLDGLRTTKRVVWNCLTCFRFKAVASQQLMANLPQERVSISRAFKNVGVDFGGPFFIKSSNLRKAPIQKGYVAVFVCMTTKAVHIELVSDLSTEAFIATLKRFIARRGLPSIIYSDNASNFLGSRNVLKELYDFFRTKPNLENIKEFLSPQEIQWKFIPPKSPHWGGIWEAAIKSTKYHLRRIIGESRLTFEEFSTVLTQIESILNSRPLLPMSSDTSDLSCLTPSHFLIGENISGLPEQNLIELPISRLSRWQHCSRIHQIFWKRWSKEYLNLLQHRPKWLKPYQDLKINDLVLLKDDNLRPLEWLLARVVDVLPGQDNRVRTVKIRTKDGIYTRSITSLCRLPQDDETQQ